MSDEQPLPEEFLRVLSDLEKFNGSAASLSQKAQGLARISSLSVDGLRTISEKVTNISGLVKGLKSSLIELRNLNSELQSKINSSTSDFEQKRNELETTQRSQIEQERAKHAAEIAELEAKLSQLSSDEKQRALDAANEAAAAQQEAMKLAHEEEKTRLLNQYQELNKSLLRKLEMIAQNQGEVIMSLEEALSENPDAVTETLSSIQTQILSMLDVLQNDLQPVPINEASNDSNLPPPPPPQEQRVLTPVITTPGLVNTSAPDTFENLKAPGDIDVETLENSTDPVPEQAGAPPSNQTELFYFMVRVLADRARSGLFGENAKDTYTQLKGYIKSWEQLTRDSSASLSELKTAKKNVYMLTNLLFNQTRDISPKSEGQIILQLGGKRKKTHKHKKGNVKTRGKMIKKKGSKKHGGRKYSKKH